MRILSFDISTKTGWVIGNADRTEITYGLELLKDTKINLNTAARDIGRKVRDFCLLPSWRPDLIVVEAPINPAPPRDQKEGQQPFFRNMASILIPQQGLGAILGLAACWDIRVETVHAATVRKHFIGKGRLGTSKETKLAVVRRCHQLGYLPPSESDDNIADAFACFEYACATWGPKNVAAPFALFGQGAVR